MIKWTTLILLLANFTFCQDLPWRNFESTKNSRDYYSGTEGLSGQQLKDKLHSIIKNHKVLSYDQLWDALSYTDEADSNNVTLFYTGWKRLKSQHGGGISEWNREHVWAKSRGDFGTSQGPGTDAHHIRPTDVTVNSKRGSLDFDNGGVLYTDNDGATECRVDDDSWEPRDEVKGDVARMVFYMAVRYEAGDRVDLEIINHTQFGTKSPVLGKLSTLLLWHRNDPPDLFEQRRNERIQEVQGNRNPFIDHPEFVDKIWGERNFVTQTHSVKQALRTTKGQSVTVRATIIGEFNQQYGILLSDIGYSGDVIAVKLPKNMRQKFSPLFNPNMLGKKIVVIGKRGEYANFSGIVEVSALEIVE